MRHHIARRSERATRCRSRVAGLGSYTAHAPHEVHERAERSLGRIAHRQRELGTVDTIQELVQVCLGRLAERGRDLLDSASTMSLETIKRAVHLPQLGSVRRVEHGHAERADAAQRIQIVRYTARILGDPGGVTLTEEEVADEERVGVRPTEAQVLGRVTRCVDGFQYAMVGVHLVSMRDRAVDSEGAREERLGSPHGRVDEGRQWSRGTRMITVPVGKENGDRLGARYPCGKGPNVGFHVRARIDDSNPPAPNEVRARAVECERPGVPGVEEIRTSGQEARCSATSCSASLSATPISWISSSSVNAPLVSESRSI